MRGGVFSTSSSPGWWTAAATESKRKVKRSSSSSNSKLPLRPGPTRWPRIASMTRYRFVQSDSSTIPSDVELGAGGSKRSPMIASHIAASSSSPKRTTISFAQTVDVVDVAVVQLLHRSHIRSSCTRPRLPVRVHRSPRALGSGPGTRPELQAGERPPVREQQGEDPLVELDHLLLAETAVEQEIDQLRYPAAIDPVDDLRLVGKEVGKLRGAVLRRWRWRRGSCPGWRCAGR